MATRSTWRRTRARAPSSPTTPTSRPAPPLSQTPTRCGARPTWCSRSRSPIAEEYHRMRPGLTLFTYLHLAADKPCTDALLANKVTGIAYETVQLADGSLPLLAPMSEVAGRLGPQVGAYHLMRPSGGYGALLGGVPGTYAVQRRRHRRRRLRPARRADRGRHGRAGHRPRPQHRPAPPDRRDLPGPDPDRRVQRLRDRARRARRRPGHRRGAGHRGQGPQARLQRAGLAG